MWNFTVKRYNVRLYTIGPLVTIVPTELMTISVFNC